MIPGPNYVYECPNCRNLLIKRSISSENTFGAKIFSDGKRIVRMFPEFPNLTKCKKCDTIFWLSKLEAIGTYKSANPDNPKWQKADLAEFLDIDEYNIAIKTGVAENKKEELFIRQRIWWAYNDRYRNDCKIFIDEDDELNWRANVNELMNLLDQTDISHSIILAELNRNLGNFEKCISIIESIDNEELNWIKDKFLNECERKNRFVIQLTSGL